MKRRANLIRRQDFWKIVRGTVRPSGETPGFAGGSPGAGQGEAEGVASVPCLNSNISPGTTNLLSPYHQKSAFALSENVSRFCQLYGLENCGFLTLTFREDVTDHREASRRFDSMNKNFLSRFYGEWIWTREHHHKKRSGWHYHTIIQCKGDIRTGFDWEEFLQWVTDYQAGKKRRLKTGNPLLRSLWDLNKRAFPSYGFGRVELLPIRSTSEFLAKYVGKYISKQIGQRTEADKGVRLTSHSSGFVASSPKFSWNTEGAKEWRRKLRLFAHLSCCCSDYDDFTARAGPKWAYRYKEMILSQDDWLKQKYPQEAPF